MTDLEMTKLCAEAMGYSEVHKKGDAVYSKAFGERVPGIYWPIEDDAQAMALVRKYRLCLEPVGYRGGYRCAFVPWGNADERGSTINRAIVKCVAKMQAAKK